MIDHTNIPENTMFMLINILDDGKLAVKTGHNLGEDIPDEVAAAYKDFWVGLNMVMGMGTELLTHLGTMSRIIASMDVEDDDDEDVVGFEPDEELLKAISAAKVVKLKDRMN